MSTKQNLRQALSVNVTAVDHDGNIADQDLTVSEFLEYMSALQKTDCDELQYFTVTFLSFPVQSESANTLKAVYS